MVMPGALLEIAREIPQQNVEAALQHLVNNARWLDLDRRAIPKGRELFRENSAKKATTAVPASED
jgi:2-oxoisovalerate ferredoxin oxidoreductase beta subunit